MICLVFEKICLFSFTHKLKHTLETNHGLRLAAKPLVPSSGPRGCRTTIILRPPRAASSRFMAFNFDISRSGRFDELKIINKPLKYSRIFLIPLNFVYLNFLTQQAECFPVLLFVTTTNSTSSPCWRGSLPSTSLVWKNNFLPSSTS